MKDTTTATYLDSVTIETYTLISAMNIMEFLEMSTFNKETGKTIEYRMIKFHDSYRILVEEPILEELVDLIEVQVGVHEIRYDDFNGDYRKYVYVKNSTKSKEDPSFLYFDYPDNSLIQASLDYFQEHSDLIKLISESDEGCEIHFSDVTLTVDRNKIDSLQPHSENDTNLK